jgi:hypothetical protein
MRGLGSNKSTKKIELNEENNGPKWKRSGKEQAKIEKVRSEKGFNERE